MATDLPSILNLSVPVIVELGRRTMSLEDILALGPGAIIELNRDAEEQLDLLVNNKRVGCGTAVKVGENFGLRVSRIGSQTERVQAMAGGRDP